MATNPTEIQQRLARYSEVYFYRISFPFHCFRTGQAMHALRNIETRSRYHYYRRKEVSSKYSECVCILALVI